MHDVLFKAVKETTEAQSALISPIPFYLQSAANLLAKGHLLWWSIKDYTLFKQTQQRNRTEGNPIAYGAALHLLSEYSTTVGYIVKVALIAKCAEDLLQQYCRVYQAYSNLKAACTKNYPRYYSYDWNKLHTKPASYFPSFYLSLHLKGVKFVQTISKILRYISKLIIEMTTLAMRSTDVYLIANGNALAHLRACTEMIGDWKKYQARLTEDYTFLLIELDNKKELTDSILKKIGIEKRTIDLISSLRHLAAQIGKHLPTFLELAQETVEPIFVEGKITALNLDFVEEEPPTLKPARYPPWTGEHLDA